MIGTQALILATMLTAGVVAYKDWFNSSETAREAFVIEHEIPSGQWQIILNSLREFYNLIEDIDAPQLHSTELKFKIGKTARIIRDYITKNIDIIYKYSQEQNIDPAFLAAIVVTEQMDLTEYSLIRNRATDRIGPYAGHDSSRGPGQITDEAFKEFCAGIRWPYYGNKLTKELSWLQRHDILQGEGDNIDSHIQAIAAILRGKRNLINDNAVIDLSPFQADLQLAQSYTSRSIRGPVPEETRNLCKMTQLRESETLRMQIYAHWVLIHRDLIKKLSFYYGYPHVFDKSFLQKSSSAGQSLNVRQGESLSLADQSPDRLQALLGVSIAVAAFNQKTEESRLSHFFPVVPMTDLSDSNAVKWKQSYMKRLIGDIKGDEWNVAVIGSDTDLEVFSEDFKLTPEDLYDYLTKQEVNNIHLDPIFTTKIVYLNSPGKVTIILNAYGDIQYPIDLSTQKPFLDGGITVADIVKNIVLQGNQTSAFVFSWLNIERIHELEQIIEGLDREDALLSADARFNMAYILADFVIRKALAGADHLRSLDMSYKTSSSGIRVLNEELYVNIGKAMDKNIKPLYDPLSYLGLGRVTFITNARSFTEVDREHLRRLAM